LGSMPPKRALRVGVRVGVGVRVRVRVRVRVWVRVGVRVRGPCHLREHPSQLRLRPQIHLRQRKCRALDR